MTYFVLKRPDLHSWTTSMTWGTKRMPNDYDFVNLIRRNIYDAKVNAVIPGLVSRHLPG